MLFILALSKYIADVKGKYPSDSIRPEYNEPFHWNKEEEAKKKRQPESENSGKNTHNKRTHTHTSSSPSSSWVYSHTHTRQFLCTKWTNGQTRAHTEPEFMSQTNKQLLIECPIRNPVFY